MPRGRPPGRDGAVAFHLTCYAVSNKAVPTVGGVPYFPNGKRPPQPDRFEAYLGRAHAAEVISPADFAGYLERPGSEDLLAAGSKVAFATSSALLSNISSDPKERERYWRLVGEFAKKPRLHALLFHADRCPEFWAALDPSAELPPKLFEHLLRIKAQAEAHFGCEETRYRRFAAEPLEVTADEAGEYLLAVRQTGRSLQPVTFRSGPAGRTQYRMEIELPHNLSGVARHWVVLRFCRLLSSLGLMWTAAPHRPGDHGDRRNNHFHVIWHDRPAKLMRVAADVPLRTKENLLGPPGSPTIHEWDFAVAVPGRHKKNANRRTYPFRQKKIERVSQNSRRTGIEESGQAFKMWLRECYADIVNEALRVCGSRRRFDPRRFNERQLNWVATKHLGNNMAALEADGVPTALGVRNALSRWSDLCDQNCISRTRKTLPAEKARTDAEARLSHRPVGSDRSSFQDMVAKRWRMALQIEQDKFDLRQIRLYRKRALSRARVVAKAPMRTIRRTAAQRLLVERRAVAALGHISAVEDAFASVAAGLQELKLDIAKREGELERLTQKIEAALSAPREVQRRSPPEPAASGVDARTQTRGARPADPTAAAPLVPPGSRGGATRAPERAGAFMRDRPRASGSVPTLPPQDPYTLEQRAVLAELSSISERAREHRWRVVELDGRLSVETHPDGPPKQVLEDLLRLRTAMPGFVHIALTALLKSQEQDERIRRHVEERRTPKPGPQEALPQANASPTLAATADREQTGSRPAGAAALVERSGVGAAPAVILNSGEIKPPAHSAGAKPHLPLSQSASSGVSAADSARCASGDNVGRPTSVKTAESTQATSTQGAAAVPPDAPAPRNGTVTRIEAAEDHVEPCQHSDLAPAAAGSISDDPQRPETPQGDGAGQEEPRGQMAAEAHGCRPSVTEPALPSADDWAAALRRIEANGNKIFRTPGLNGAAYRVDGLSPETASLVLAPQFATRTQQRLAEIWRRRAVEATETALELVEKHRATPGVITFREGKVEFAGLPPEELDLIRKCAAFPAVKTLLQEIEKSRAEDDFLRLGGTWQDRHRRGR